MTTQKDKHKTIAKPKKKASQKIKAFGIVFIAFLVILLGYKVFAGNKSGRSLPFLLSSTEKSTPTPKTTPETAIEYSIPSAETDSDQDGLSDALEIVYKTDPNNQDTDGDGYKDGAEVTNGYNPLIKSPNDKIKLAANTTKENSASTLPSPPTFTQQFINKTGIKPTKENLETNETQVNEFINETNARGVLPIILDSDIKIINASGKAAIIKYLDTLSVAKNTKLKPVTPEEITVAFTLMAQKGDPAQLTKIIAILENNASIFRSTEVPKEAVELHKKYLAAVLALLDDTRMLKNYKADYVSALVAASRLEGLKPIFTEIEADITALEKKYGIK